MLGYDDLGREVYDKPKVYSCHDSAWRDDGTETILRDLQIQGLLDFGIKEVNPNEYHEYRTNKKYWGKEIYNEEIMEQDFEKQECNDDD